MMYIFDVIKPTTLTIFSILHVDYPHDIVVSI